MSDPGPEPINYGDVDELRSIGFIQEANRLFFHPHGLAVEVAPGGWSEAQLRAWLSEQADVPVGEGQVEALVAFAKHVRLDRTYISGVWDYRHDPEGVGYTHVLDTPSAPAKAERVAAVRAEFERHAAARTVMFGDPIQAIPEPS